MSHALPTTAQTVRVILYFAVSHLMMAMTWSKLGFMVALGMWCTWMLGLVAGRVIGNAGLAQEKDRAL